jgi:tetrahydromethanopterin S-methyltransferase subunit G
VANSNKRQIAATRIGGGIGVVVAIAVGLLILYLILAN